MVWDFKLNNILAMKIVKCLNLYIGFQERERLSKESSMLPLKAFFFCCFVINSKRVIKGLGFKSYLN